jgi:hypothetical protein
MQSAAKTGTTLSKDEMPIKLLYIGIIGAVILLGIVAVLSVEQMSVMRGIAMALLGTIWIWMAGVILSECIGRTNWSPMSGMTLIAVTYGSAGYNLDMDGRRYSIRMHRPNKLVAHERNDTYCRDYPDCDYKWSW